MVKKKTVAIDLTEATPEVVAATAAPLVRQANESLQAMAEIRIDSQDTYKLVVQVVSEIKEASATAEATRDFFVKPLEGIVKTYKSYFKPGIDALAEAERLGKRALEAFIVKSAQLRDRMINDSARAPDEDVREAMLIAADEHRVDELPGVQVRTLWNGRVTDVKLIPREYMIPDIATLMALTRARKGDPEIPGWEATPNASVAITTSKVEK